MADTADAADTGAAWLRAHGVRLEGAQHMEPQHSGAIGGVIAMVVMVLKRDLIWRFFGSKSRRARIRFK